MAKKIMRVGVGGIEGAINQLAQDFVREIEKDTEDAVKTGAKVAKKSIESSSSFQDRSGVYRKGWRTEVTGNAVTGHTAVVYQKLHPGKPHLLEKGHGGPAPAKAHPHIQIAADEGAQAMWRVLGGCHG